MEEFSDRPTSEKPTATKSSSRGWLLLLVGLVVGAGVTIGINLTTQTESSAEALVGRWIAALEDEDMEALVPLYSEDVIWEDQALGDLFEGHGGIRRAWGIFVLEGFEFQEISAVAVGDNSAAVRWTMSGAKSPFTGGAWESTGISVLEISGDEITAETVYYDSRDIQ